MAKILLVEDNELNRDMLSRRLARRGYEVVIAVERRLQQRLGRVRLTFLDMSQRKTGIFDFTRANIARGAILRTDGDPLYRDIDREVDVTHEPVVLLGAEQTPDRLLPGTHRVASLLNRWLAGTLHNGHSTVQLGYYLDEFTFRFNRRNSRNRGLLWLRLVEQAVNTDPYPYSEIAAAGADHRQCPLHSSGYPIRTYEP